MSDKIELNRRRVLGGLVTIGAAGAAVGAGTFALFSDEETSDGNAISAGTLRLEDPTTGAISVNDAKPGDRLPSEGAYELQVDYAGTIDPEVDVSVSLSDPDTDSSDPSNLASELELETASLVRVEGETVNVTSDLASEQGISTLNDLDDLNRDNAFGDVTDGNSVGLHLALNFPSNVSDNSLQGESVAIDVTFNARQPDPSP